MKIRQIEIFRAVMQTGSVTGAAESLHVSQPGVSRMLAHIELQLGLTLFDRIKGKLRPTPEAETLYAQVEQVYSGVRRIEACAKELKAGTGLSLRVLCSPNMGLRLVPEAIATTIKKYPEARIYLEVQLVREMMNQLETGQADIGICSMPVDQPRLRVTRIGEWQLNCVFPKDHIFSSKRGISPRDILKQKMITFSSDTPQGRIIQQWCNETGLQPQSQIEVRSGQAACALAACGAGVAVVDNFTAQSFQDPRLEFRPVISGPKFPIFAVTNNNVTSSSVMKSFTETLKTSFRGG